MRYRHPRSRAADPVIVLPDLMSPEECDARIREVKTHPDIVRLDAIAERLGRHIEARLGVAAYPGRGARATRYTRGHGTPGQRRLRRRMTRAYNTIAADLVLQYYRLVRSYALRRPIRGMDADDLTAELVFAVPLALSRLDLTAADPGPSPGAHEALVATLYSAMIGLRTAILRRRGSSRHASIDGSEDGSLASAIPDRPRNGLDFEDLDWLRAALDSLGDRRAAEILRLRYLSDMTLRETSQSLAVPITKERVRQIEGKALSQLRYFAGVPDRPGRPGAGGSSSPAALR